MIIKPEFKIKQIRELKNFTQEFIAISLGISIRAYSKIESGETGLSIRCLNEIFNALNVPPLEILAFDEKQVFNHCKQEGSIFGDNHNYTSKEMISQYEKRINHLENEIEFLRSQFQLKK